VKNSVTAATMLSQTAGYAKIDAGECISCEQQAQNPGPHESDSLHSVLSVQQLLIEVRSTAQNILY